MVQFKNNTRRSGKDFNARIIHLNDLRRSIFKGTNDSGLRFSQKSGNFTSHNVTLMETAINNNILRIPLKRYNLTDLKSKVSTRRLYSGPQKRNNLSKRHTQRTVALNGCNSLSIPLPKSKCSIKKNETENGKKLRKVTKDKIFPKRCIEDIQKLLIKKNRSTQNTRKPNVNITNTTSKITTDKSNDQLPKIKRPRGRPKKVFINLNVNLTSATSKLVAEKSSKHRVLEQQQRRGQGRNKKVLRKFGRRKGKVQLFPITRAKRKSELMVVLNKSEIPKREKSSSLLQTKYYLKCKKYHSSAQSGKLNYGFKTLVNDVRQMSLPSPTWKIKIMIKQNKVVSAIKFTNKLELERSVTFVAETGNYDIIVDNEPVLLLGSPGIVNNIKDIEILLELVNTIEKHDPMILYKLL